MRSLTVYISWWIIGVLLVSCQRAPKKACNPPCLYNAPCVEGFCQCPLPYEGTYCEKDGRERFVGTWEGRKRCDGTTGGLRYRIWANDSLLLYMFIAGRFHGTNEETLGVRFLDAYKLFIPSQTLRDTPILVSGYAEQRQDSLYLTLERQGGANRIDTCYWDLKRR